MVDMEDKSNEDQMAADKERRERLEAKNQERFEALNEEANNGATSFKKNLYIIEFLTLQILFIFVSGFVF
uniref:Uncharacterized protein n=1 Tax=Panagrolaimus sp. ES5 TaxID=591445 RepID=A0AC34F9U3_9BILA